MMNMFAKHCLNVPVIISSGSCYNYITGEYSRALMRLQKAAMEWLFRMVNDSKKLSWRIAVSKHYAIYHAVRHDQSNSHTKP